MKGGVMAGRMLAGLLLWLCALTGAGASVPVSSLALGPMLPPSAIAVFEDTGGHLPFAQVQTAAGNDLFRPLGSEPLVPGFSASAWWQRFVLVNDTGDAQRLYLSIAEPGVDELRLYRVRDGVAFQFLPLGRLHPAGNTPVSFRQPLFVLDMPAGAEDRYYLRAVSETSMVLTLRVEDESGFERHRSSDLLMTALYGAVVLTMFIYNLFLYVTVRERSYLAYCLSILAIFLAMVTVDGWHLAHLGDNTWLKQRLYTVLAFIAGVSVLWFTMVFLETRRHLPKLHHAMQLLLLAFAVMAVITPFYYGRPLAIATDVLTLLVIALVLVTGLVLSLRGYRPAMFFTLAWSATLLGAAVTILAGDGFLPPAPIFRDALKIGQVAEVMLMALALAHRITTINEQRDSALRTAALAQARAEARTQFLAHMSHEIRTPMNGVVGMAQLLADTNLDVTQRDMVRTIQHSGESLVTIIDDVLDTARLEAGRIELRRQPVALRPLLAGVVDTFRGVARQRGIELAAGCDPKLPVAITVDPVRLRQLLLNLVSNAVRFTDHGSVVLQAAPSDEGRTLRITVRDTGIGIPAEKLPQVFDSFYQVGGTGAHGRGGTGLGLTIARELARLMGGDIAVESVVGVGSCFIASVPLEAVDLPGETPVADVAAGDGERWRGRRTLVCEDNPVNQMVIRGLLERIGLEVDLVSRGEDAVMQAQLRDYDIIFMDRNLPGIDGMEAARRIRADERVGARRPVPIIALTADALAEHRAECLAAGMNAHLAKPVRAADIDAVIRQWLGA